MRYQWIDEYLLGKRAVTRDLQPEWNWIRYKIGDRMFAAVLLDDRDQPYYINLKLEQTEGEFLRGQYKDIIPGYYSDKRCWNSVKPDGKVPDFNRNKGQQLEIYPRINRRRNYLYAAISYKKYLAAIPEIYCAPYTA